MSNFTVPLCSVASCVLFNSPTSHDYRGLGTLGLRARCLRYNCYPRQKILSVAVKSGSKHGSYPMISAHGIRAPIEEYISVVLEQYLDLS